VFLSLLFEQNAENRKIRNLTGFVVIVKRKMPVAARDDDGDDNDDDDDDSNRRRVSRCSCLQFFGDFFTSSRQTQAFTTDLATDKWDT
jgi:hypothetical protein